MNTTPKWRVECPPKTWPENQCITLAEAAHYDSWIVRSPRGAVVFRPESRAAALQIARSMAAIDQLLERVNHLERKPPYPIIGGYGVTAAGARGGSGSAGGPPGGWRSRSSERPGW